MSEQQKTDGGPAFPVPDTIDPIGQLRYGTNGMTLRDYFAAQVASTLISMSQNRDGGWEPGDVSAGAYATADAMLAERSK